MGRIAFKFRYKVLLALASSVLLSLGVFIAITLWRLEGSAEQRIRLGMENATDAFYRSRQQQSDAVDEAVDSLASSNPELRAVLANSEGASDPFQKPNASLESLQILESSLPFLPLYKHATEFAVFDRSGRPLLMKDRALLAEDSPVVVKEAMKGTRSYDWWTRNGKTLQVFASPVVVQQDVVGVILVGYPVDKNFLGPMAKLTRTEIEIAPENLPAESGLFEIERNGAWFLASIVNISNANGRKVGAFLVSRSLEEELGDARALRNQLLALGALVLLVVISLGLYLANLVSRPLEKLGSAVREVKMGNFAFRLESKSRDEFGTLSNLIDEMSAGLEEREKIRATFSRYVGVKVAGRSEPEFVYELVPELTEAMQIYSGCLDLISEGKGEMAAERLAAHPSDKPSQALLEKWKLSKGEWNGIWSLGK